MITDDGAMTWFALRERRASMRKRSKLDESAERRNTFSAAMQQFEEQFTAAKVVTTATRPINLYYGLVQAGMAIVAARAENPWSFSRHGLKLDGVQNDLPKVLVRPESSEEKGAFQAVAKATGSALIGGPVSLGDLWAAVPDLSGLTFHGSGSPQSMFLLPDVSVTYYNPHLSVPYMVEPGPIAPRASVYDFGEMPNTEEERAAWLTAFIERYPGAHGAAFPDKTDEGIFERIDDGRFRVAIEWPAEAQTHWTDEGLDVYFDQRAPKYVYQNDRFLRPSVESGLKPAPSPLMTWWLLLYSFSMIARYRPQKWVSLLDFDKSPDAAAIQYATETALTTIPHLVLEALDGKPRLIAKPMRL